MNSLYSWVRDYVDVAPCLELSAVYDDALKKDRTFMGYAIKLARRIAREHRLPCKVTYGKWGARLETARNRNISETELECCAKVITSDLSWLMLRESTRVFTFGTWQSED